MISYSSKGDFKNLNKYLKDAKKISRNNLLERYGKEGVVALQQATPINSGVTASSWYYEIENNDGVATIAFYNSNVNKGVPIAVILQYGHATRNGGWVEGVDYINPAIQPIFEKIAQDAWKEVTNL